MDEVAGQAHRLGPLEEGLAEDVENAFFGAVEAVEVDLGAQGQKLVSALFPGVELVNQGEVTDLVGRGEGLDDFQELGVVVGRDQDLFPVGRLFPVGPICEGGDIVIERIEDASQGHRRPAGDAPGDLVPESVPRFAVTLDGQLLEEGLDVEEGVDDLVLAVELFKKLDTGPVGLEEKMEIALVEGQEVDAVVTGGQIMGGVERIDSARELDDDFVLHDAPPQLTTKTRLPTKSAADPTTAQKMMMLKYLKTRPARGVE